MKYYPKRYIPLCGSLFVSFHILKMAHFPHALKCFQSNTMQWYQFKENTKLSKMMLRFLLPKASEASGEDMGGCKVV